MREMSSRPKCIIVTGRPGSGKTSLAKRLAERMWMPVISRDEIKEGYVIVCSVDPMVAARRHLQRGLADPNREFYHGDKRVEVYRETGEMAPPGEYAAPDFDVPTMHVSTEGEYSPSMDEIVKRIRRPEE